jgi:hypothetical protein
VSPQPIFSETEVPREQWEHALHILTGLTRDQVTAYAVVILRPDGSPSVSSDLPTTEAATALLAYGLHAQTATALTGGAS